MADVMGVAKLTDFILCPVPLSLVHHYRCDPRVQNRISLHFFLSLFFSCTFFPQREISNMKGGHVAVLYSCAALVVVEVFQFLLNWGHIRFLPHLSLLL